MGQICSTLGNPPESAYKFRWVGIAHRFLSNGRIHGRDGWAVPNLRASQVFVTGMRPHTSRLASSAFSTRSVDL